MNYKVTITNLGRNKAIIEKISETEPDYNVLYGMVRKHLLSSEIDFMLHNDGYPMTGRVIVGGFRPVGDILIEAEGLGKVAEAANG